MRSQKSEVRSQRRTTAFTLVELMVAIALVVILMYGVTKVFTTTQSVVSQNQSISDHTRDARAAQTVFARDFGNFAGDGPCMIIHSQTRPAFRNRADMDGDRDFNPANGPAAQDTQKRTQDLDGDNTETGANELTPPAVINNRNHRVDTMSFFARGLFKRQTGGDVASSGASPLVANMSGNEAWIWYGQLRIANGAGSFLAQQDPGMGTFSPNSNDNNFFATQWVLGRETMLLREKNSAGQILDNNNRPQIFIDNASQLSPLSYQSGDSIPGGTFEIQQSRYDVAATSISDYRGRLSAYITANANGTWWQSLFGSAGTRFQTNPLITKPITPITFSQQAPIFMRACTSFAVEFAGDYVAQDNNIYLPNTTTVNPNYGVVNGVYKSAAAPASTNDGVIDYIAIQPPAGSPPGTLPTKRIRWYGLPRNANGSTNGPNGPLWIPGYTSSPANANNLTEVVPLRDVWRTFPPEASNTSGAPFERNVNNPNGGVPPANDYMTALTTDNEYNVAWGPNDPKPKMIRITLVLDDPLGRTPEGQTFEYVFTLP